MLDKILCWMGLHAEPMHGRCTSCWRNAEGCTMETEQRMKVLHTLEQRDAAGSPRMRGGGEMIAQLACFDVDDRETVN